MRWIEYKPGLLSRFKVAGGRATRASPLCGDNRLWISYKVLPSFGKLATRWRDCGGEYMQVVFQCALSFIAGCLFLRVVAQRKQGHGRGLMLRALRHKGHGRRLMLRALRYKIVVMESRRPKTGMLQPLPLKLVLLLKF